MAVFFFKRYENRSTQRKTSLRGQEPTTNPQMMPPRLEARPHWWQVSAPPTAPRLLFTCNQCSKSAVRLQKQLHLKLKGDSIHRLLNCGHSHREILCKVAQPWPSQVSSFRYILVCYHSPLELACGQALLGFPGVRPERPGRACSHTTLERVPPI